MAEVVLTKYVLYGEESVNLIIHHNHRHTAPHRHFVLAVCAVSTSSATSYQRGAIKVVDRWLAGWLVCKRSFPRHMIILYWHLG